MKTVLATKFTQGVADDGTLQTFTPQPSEFHVIFYDPVTNSECWGIESEPARLKRLLPNKGLGVIVASGGFLYYRVIE